MENNSSIVFGPVPSRRLGRSMGVNNIPPKICTYSCVYCQLGRTIKMQTERQEFYNPDNIISAVQNKVEDAIKAGERIDYLTFVPDGEPTLDINLEREINALKPLGFPIAVITNSSLIWSHTVREALYRADWVSLKVDAVKEKTWRKIDRPHRSLDLTAILNGMLTFSHAFRGKLMTETMLISRMNDSVSSLSEIADFLYSLRLDKAYLSIPIRPPADKKARASNEHAVNRAFQILNRKIKNVEYLTGYEGNAFASTGDVEQDILSITAVHPMRDDAMDDFLKRAGAHWDVIHRLEENDLLMVTKYGNKKFYMRKFSQKRPG